LKVAKHCKTDEGQNYPQNRECIPWEVSPALDHPGHIFEEVLPIAMRRAVNPGALLRKEKDQSKYTSDARQNPTVHISP
jgi:hypothetical protein